MFAEDGSVVTSPFLGLMLARDFFDKLGGATRCNVVTPIDMFLPSGDQQHVVAYFQHDWTVNDGTLITFNVMVLFEFRPGTDKVGTLTLIYDTHPIRQTAGNKYEGRVRERPGPVMAVPGASPDAATCPRSPVSRDE